LLIAYCQLSIVIGFVQELLDKWFKIKKNA